MKKAITNYELRINGSNGLRVKPQLLCMLLLFLVVDS